ncbi:MAG: N-acetyltransferase [Clostridia bacterium]|nr:N-acetyltransferase [Clostridia bacterium]
MCTELKRIIKSMEDKYLNSSLDMVRRTFTDYENADEADLAVRLIKEIRAMDTYIPELELIMVNDDDEVIGYAMFSRFHLGGKYRDELLVLSPVAVKIELQRQHISKEIIEYGFEKAKQMGFSAVIVEGNPQNYQSRGFRTSADFGIIAGESVGLPVPECLMVKELADGTLDHIQGVVEYTDFKCLQ